MPRGGRMAGAGRPKGCKNKKPYGVKIAEAEARAILIERILEDWEPLIEVMKKCALGEIRTIQWNGKAERVYTKAPDPKVFLEMIGYLVGKPKQEIGGTVSLPEIQKLTDVMQDVLNKR